MAANPIYIETEEEIPEVVERLRSSVADDVPLVLPARSRLGQSRFNFQLLRQYAAQFGKRITIISPEPAVQQMAEESGLAVVAAVDDIGAGPNGGNEAPAAGGRSAIAAVAAAASRVDAADRVRVAMRAPDRLLTKVASESHPGRFLLYVGAALVAIVGCLCLAMFVPSASVTLVAQARPFSQEADLVADPGKAPIRVRTVDIPASSSQGFKATGTKTTPAAGATGQVVFTNKCDAALSFDIPTGQTVSGGGVNFAVTQGGRVAGKSTATFPVQAAAPGAASNVGPHTINSFSYPNTPTGQAAASCLSVDNPSAMAGGADEVKQPQITQADYDAARSQLEQQLRQGIQDQLGKQTQAGETLATLINFDAPQVNTDHKVGDTVGNFNMQMNLKGQGAFYFADDVRKALQENLAKKVPANSVLTDNKVQSDFTLAGEDPGGHLSFHGKAQSYIAPKLNYDQVRSRVTGKPTSQARAYLLTLPVQSVVIKEKPFSLPVMPVLNSRIDIKYVVQTAPASQPT